MELGPPQSAMHAPWALPYPSEAHSLAVRVGEQDTAELPIPGAQVQGQERGKDPGEAEWEGVSTSGTPAAGQHRDEP